MKPNLSELSDKELIDQICALDDAIDQLSDSVAEILSERAMFGDSGPGTQRCLDAYNKALADWRELRGEYSKRYPVYVPDVPEEYLPF